MTSGWQQRSGTGASLALAILVVSCTGHITENVPPADSGGTAAATGGTNGTLDGSAASAGRSSGSGGESSATGGSTNGGESDSGGSGAGGSGAGGSSGTAQTSDPSAFGTCPTGDPDPGVTPLSKLSTVQYRNTVQDLLSASGLDDLVATVAPLLDAVPDDSTQASFRGLDKRISSDHISGYYNVAIAIGDGATQDASHLTALAGSCATKSTLSSSCLDAFLNDFGQRALRHPLTSDELAEYEDVAQGSSPTASSPAEALRNVVVTLLMAPRFVNHLELEGTPVSGRDDYLALSPYEVAARLSYTFWQTMPDDELMSAAADGSLATDDGFDKELTRVFSDARTQQTIWQFWNEWMRFEAFTGFSSERPAFQALAAGEHLGEPGHDHWGDMVQEIRDLTELYTWKQTGTLLDLMTSTVSVTPSADLAHLYGVTAWSGSGAYPTLPDGTRSGLLTRSALLASSLETTNPFHRGAQIRRAILCEDLEPPDPNSLPAGSLDPPPQSEVLTTRERYEAKIAGNDLCLGCHRSFSNIGYTLEAYDSLGRFRTDEQVFDEQTGDLLATLPLDTVASVQIGDGPASDVSGPLDLNQRIIDSGMVEPCLAANYFRYTLRRDPTANSADACAFENMQTALTTPGVGLSDVFRDLATEPAFRTRKVGPQ
jgi:Protein of unknown function (DUF1592)/Protein of unknown function (DUF1588)/Protein of unknown function (DUF1595)/Protein of unknown function (DUF1587)